MRVVQVIAPGPMAGAERMVIEGSRALVRRGLDVELTVLSEVRHPECAAAFVEEAIARGLATTVIPVEGRIDLSAVAGLRREWRALKPSIVHPHGYKALAYTLAAVSKDTAVVTTHHGETAHSPDVAFYECLSHVLYGATRCVFAVSDETARSLRARGVSTRVTTVENAISFAAPRALRARPEQGTPTRLLYLGRLSPEKGLDVLLEALSVIDDRDAWLLTVAGDGPERSRLERLASELGVASRVRFLGHRKDVAALLDDADMLVLPSRREGLPLAVLEAAALGVPVVASAVGGVPSVVEHGVTGRLVPADDSAALASALEGVRAALDDYTWSARVHAKSVRARFSFSRWADSTVDGYLSAVA